FLAGALVIAAMRARKIVLPLVAIVAAVVVLASPEMQDRMASIFNPYHPNNVTRLQMWTVGIRIFLDKPIVGVGDIGIEKVWNRYADPGWEPAGHLHNNMLLWLATLGIVGFVVLVALFVKLWSEVRAIEKNYHNDWFIGSLSLGCLAAMAGFHVNGLFEWNFGDAEIMMLLWSLVGLTFAAKRVASVESPNA
ncbi:MAG TPA: O-antigen ligase family protein, partial [Bacteroidota bacterium]|nr:O-antigen ligase family protein [Bacteroidota bacterium]